MIEKIVYDYLKSTLAPIPVFTQIPSAPPKEFVLFIKTGSDRENYITVDTVMFHSYSDSLLGSVKLAEKLRNVLDDMPNVLDTVGGTYFNGEYNNTDTNYDVYRYTTVYEISH